MRHELERLHATVLALMAERDALRAAEHSLSDAYLRLRQKLNAFDTPFAPTPQQVWAHTEACLDALQAPPSEGEVEAATSRFWNSGADVVNMRTSLAVTLRSVLTAFVSARSTHASSE